MKSNHYLEQQIKEVVGGVELSTSSYGDIDTCSVLCELASTLEWGEAEFEHVDFLSKRIDISKKLFVAYLSNGRKAVDLEITDNACLELVVALLLKAVFIRQNDFPVGLRLKRFNTLFKALELIKPKWLLAGTELGIEMESLWQSSLQALSSATDDLKITPLPNMVVRNSEIYKEVPITVLFYEGPIARAYLATLKSLGFRPKKIIELVAAKDVATNKVVGKWLPRGLRSTYAASIQRNKIHYWPKQLSKTNSDFVNSIFDEVQKKFGFEMSVIDNANLLLPLTEYSNCVEPILVEGLNDKGLQQYLEEEPKGAILYTGGGIMPSKLLDIQHLKYLHIHPGFLPDIRGADCALWSSLLTGHTSATCFYMSSGIDTGDIIHPCWLPKLSFGRSFIDIDGQSLYRAIYAFFDPWVRAFVLREVLVQHESFYQLASVSQSETSGTTFHFMHQKLKAAAFQDLFNNKGN